MNISFGMFKRLMSDLIFIWNSDTLSSLSQQGLKRHSKTPEKHHRICIPNIDSHAFRHQVLQKAFKIVFLSLMILSIARTVTGIKLQPNKQFFAIKAAVNIIFPKENHWLLRPQNPLFKIDDIFSDYLRFVKEFEAKIKALRHPICLVVNWCRVVGGSICVKSRLGGFESEKLKCNDWGFKLSFSF